MRILQLFVYLLVADNAVHPVTDFDSGTVYRAHSNAPFSRTTTALHFCALIWMHRSISSLTDIYFFQMDFAIDMHIGMCFFPMYDVVGTLISIALFTMSFVISTFASPSFFQMNFAVSTLTGANLFLVDFIVSTFTSANLFLVGSRIGVVISQSFLSVFIGHGASSLLAASGVSPNRASGSAGIA